MNVLVLGSGGREHSICYNLKKSKKIKNLWCIPGNAGTNNCKSFNLDIKNNKQILNFCLKIKLSSYSRVRRIFAKGIGDYLRISGIKVFGPSKKAPY